MQGVLVVLKPPGMTSHDVVAFARRTLGLKRIGHTGTLDPAAAGVLVVCVGAATRLVEYLSAGSKEYLAEATFGFQTDTLDAVGTVVREADSSHLDAEKIEAALENFRGDISQIPPLYSAIKQDGKKLYELARQNQTIEIPSREVTISKLELTRFIPPRSSTAAGSSTHPRALFRVECSGGTYIRSLVRDVGETLECAATMTFLVRARNGHFSMDDARTPEQIEADPATALWPMTKILPLCAPLIIEDDDAISALSQGRAAPTTNEDEARVLVWDKARTRAAIAERRDGFYRAQKVFDLRN